MGSYVRKTSRRVDRILFFFRKPLLRGCHSGPGLGPVRSSGPDPVGRVPVGPVPVGLVPVGPVPVGPVPVGPVPVGPVLVGLVPVGLVLVGSGSGSGRSGWSGSWKN